LRVRQFKIRPGEVFSISGIDVLGAETFVHLVTGATLPDTGDVSLFGHNTRSITDGEACALSLTLEVDPIDPRVIPQAGALARDVGIAANLFDAPVGKVGPDVKMRVHLGRALALGPKLLIAEHPSATLPRESVAGFGADLGNVARARNLGLIAITADDSLAKAVGGTRLELVAATGELRTLSRIRRLFGAK
jgi:predicted ABC-type transport system involved in lysophospholipase L1 biosynthesis ATPase subunit